MRYVFVDRISEVSTHHPQKRLQHQPTNQPAHFISFFIKIKMLNSTSAMTTVLVAHGIRLIYYSCMTAPWQVTKNC